MNDKKTYTVASIHTGSTSTLAICVKDCLKAGNIGKPLQTVKLDKSDVWDLQQLAFPVKEHAIELINMIERQGVVYVTFEEKPTTVVDTKTLDEIRKIQKALR